MAAKRGDLNLHWRNMETVPDEVWEMTHLENLRVVGSPLTALPDLAFSSLANLKVLQLRQTGLTELPFSINSLVSLRECGLEDNKLASLPDEFGSGLKELVDLRLTNNQLTLLPEGFGEGMVKLQSLALDINFLEALPESLGKASGLQFLTVTQNCLATLPDRLADLHQLERLCVMLVCRSLFVEPTKFCVNFLVMFSVLFSVGCTLSDFVSTYDAHMHQILQPKSIRRNSTNGSEAAFSEELSCWAEQDWPIFADRIL